MLEVKNVVKSYGKIKALHGIRFELHKGNVTGFIGPNGAGKSTAMNIITGCLAPTDGDCLIDGASITKEPETAKRKVGYLPEEPPLYGAFTVKEFLKCAAEIKGIPKNEIQKHIEEVAEHSGISEVMGRLCRNLSKGYRQRTGIAYAMLGNPDYLILDEPTSGLDPRQKHEMLRFIKKLSKNCGVLLSSHILSEIEDISDTVIMIDGGRIVKSVDGGVDIENMFLKATEKKNEGNV